MINNISGKLLHDLIREKQTEYEAVPLMSDEGHKMSAPTSVPRSSGTNSTIMTPSGITQTFRGF